MKSSLLAFSFVAALLALSPAQPAEACSAPLTSVTMATTQALDGATNVAIDAPILIQAKAWPEIYPLENYSQLVLFTVEVKASGTTTLLPGKAHFFSGTLSWKPDAPLAPSTTYEVVVHVANNQPLPGDATGVVDQSFSFTTGTTSLAPLAFTSAPSYAFETRSYPSCAPGKVDSCNNCSEPTTESHPSAIVTLPTVSGGEAGGGYLVQGLLTDASGAIKTRVRRLPGSTETTLQIPIPDSVDPACLYVVVNDAAGNNVSTSSTCFTGEQIAEQIAASSGAGGSDASGSGAGGSGSSTPTTSTGGTGSGELSDKTNDPPAAKSDGGDGGCSTSGHGGVGGALLVGLAALGARVSRRRLTRAS